MILGDNSCWENFLAIDGVTRIVELLIEGWNAVGGIRSDETEDEISIRLVAAMRSAKSRQAHPFNIQYQCVEIDITIPKETGRKDIAFFPGHDEDTYFCVEAKRLRDKSDRSLASQYVREGVIRFVDSKYSPWVDRGAMLGYVPRSTFTTDINAVETNLKSSHTSFGMVPPGSWSSPATLPASPATCFKESQHSRARPPSPFSLLHIFVEAEVLPASSVSATQLTPPSVSATPPPTVAALPPPAGVKAPGGKSRRKKQG